MTLSDPFRLALVGPPNCGKTSLFNALTGARQKVGNYAGVTVERKVGLFSSPGGKRIELTDLPGTHSLRARSPDEAVTRDVVLGRHPAEPAPQLMLVVVDAVAPRSGLRLAMELVATGLPMIVVLNMIDIARHRKIEIDRAALQAELGVPVVSSTAVRRGGLDALLATLDATLAGGVPEAGPNLWAPPDAADLRLSHRAADRLIARAVTLPPEHDTLTHRIDRLLLHPVFGLVFLLGLLFVMFQAVFSWAGPVMDLIDTGFGALSELIRAHVPAGLLQSFLVDAVIGGVGGVVIFLPQIVILFLFILLLEDLGYMARAAFLMDRIMGGAGLHGRAFIPLLSSFACAIPGIMATRVIDNPRDRLTTILVAPLMTCSARIPVYTLIVAAFIPARPILGIFSLQGLVMFGLYGAGIVSALAVSAAAKFLFARGEPSPPFMLDLPDYKIPQPRSVLIGLWTRASAFLKRAGTTIFTMTVVIWVLASFPQPPEGATEPAILYSFAAGIGKLLEPILSPIGFNWQMAVAIVPAMAAREIAVAGLATVYAVSEGGGEAVLGTLLSAQWSLATALSFLVWFIFAPQCLSTLAVIRRETGSGKWMWVTVAYMFALAWVACFLTYHLAVALGWG
ncbi:ferrous iron transporter B [Rhodobacter capsulatus]|jgi:ferrous iron transport protein B|uniref:Ferrous iron transport protein B n=2 Tax=Rhodobacter capsulatus TaxID=1061 RepID=D5AUY4_RHOCB|nr:ferrous iron transporter B [Rhodobacter capsulatus]ADE85773.1 ferrous iron transport protein B-2 [Rhodobacter capsulatus SB 1003]ETD01773.1 iron transporter FeoB [Rhodobacter capsulatus DE442]ETD76841.1 iron transporter FeoB [Rhodobacter capsulatus R121]ETE53678.1 iron transporter FeoB [Rhodobacter capsulatus Y262]MDS0927505.1 ferrous iron transporter B [Rhodobacter capsulatus]